MCGLLDFLSPQKPTSNFHFKPESEYEAPFWGSHAFAKLHLYIFHLFIHICSGGKSTVKQIKKQGEILKTGRNKVKREILSLMHESSIHGRHTLIKMSLLIIYQYRFVSLHHHPCHASSINEALSSVTSVNEVKEKITSDQE